MSAELALRSGAPFPALAELAAAWSPVLLGAACQEQFQVEEFHLSGSVWDMLLFPAPPVPRVMAGCSGWVVAIVNSEASPGFRGTYLVLPFSFYINS